MDESDLINAAKVLGYTFKEFAANPDKYKKKKDQVFAAIDEGRSGLPNVKRHAYKVQTPSGMIYECGKSIEKVQYIAEQEGLRVDQLDFKPELRKDVGGDFYLEILFIVKANGRP